MDYLNKLFKDVSSFTSHKKLLTSIHPYGIVLSYISFINEPILILNSMNANIILTQIFHDMMLRNLLFLRNLYFLFEF